MFTLRQAGFRRLPLFDPAQDRYDLLRVCYFPLDMPGFLFLVLTLIRNDPVSARQVNDERCAKTARRSSRINALLPHKTAQTGTDGRLQISLAYSRMVRSLENLPTRAVLRMAILAQRALSR